MATGPSDAEKDAYAMEIARLRAHRVAGEAGRVRELFDYLAERGGEGIPATQPEIAEAVFGQSATDADDATVRVYVHRLRKRLEDFYASDESGSRRLEIPSGTYALRFAQEFAVSEPIEPDIVVPVAAPVFPRRLVIAGAAIMLVVLVGVFFIGRWQGIKSHAPVNALWQPFVESRRPTLIVLGDYYIYGEIDPVRPDEGRLIRDFRVNSANDLVVMQELHPDRFGQSEDVGLNYLPFSSAYGLRAVIPVLAREGRQISVIPASELQPDMLNYFDVIYVGLFSGLKLLEDETFTGSHFELGETYDELIDRRDGKVYTSQEARRLASSAYYHDYGYVARYRTPSGALVAILAGSRDTGLRGIAPTVAVPDLPAQVADLAGGGDFEALYQITGQQGADLSDRLVYAGKRP
ncbi:hypothetical protein GRI97_02320 [Altererythrobacter xixiisoli]|uniref:OmpR/PhoB-type domain-containing protein n=1 Tax=Croceibacterium xixiisoli TaxID=1476466 RepID=A0A6I4TPH5_9SPHN|nr:helix-turn-helix domain-containing protein [Croceibacterium xixiisoli]MXO97822.1 hypothetical protein [Croceibacterium xixiisoli]